jgi:hypothetical protein
MSRDVELLVGLSVEELEALADSFLAPAAQARLDFANGCAYWEFGDVQHSDGMLNVPEFEFPAPRRPVPVAPDGVARRLPRLSRRLLAGPGAREAPRTTGEAVRRRSSRNAKSWP